MPQLSYAVANDLRRNLTGEVLTPNEPGYIDAVTTYNGAVRHRPMAVVRPGSSADLARVLTYAGHNDIPVTARSGGHSSNGYALNSKGIVVDTRSLCEIVSDGDEISVGAGATWADLYDHLAKEDPAAFVIGATWPTVGVSGFLMGGGYSFVSRSMGLACDSILSCQFTTAEGAELQAREDSKDPDARDLFWALKGGGGGNFGIASQFRIRKHTAQFPMLTGVITFPFHRLDEVFDFYDDWVKTLPVTISVYGAIMSAVDPVSTAKSGLVIRLSFAFRGSYSDGMSLLAPLLQLRPTESRFYQMGLSQWANYLGGNDPGGQFGAYTRSAMLHAADLKSAASVLKAYLTAIPKEAVFLVWTHSGGAIGDVPHEQSAFPHREADFVFAVRVFWPVDQPELMRGLVTWGYRFFEELKPISRGAYVNYIDPLLDGWQDVYYKKSYPKLKILNEKFDSKGTMLFQQGIGSSFAPAGFVDGELDLEPIFRTFHE